ncbi:MAG: hypothetical protein WC454_03035 [Phycisphaerae bacterium]
MDIHLVDCLQCRERIRTLIFIREHFDTLWDSWTAAEHGRIYQQWQLAQALTKVAENVPSLAGQIQQWLGHLKEDVHIGAKVLLDRSKKISSIASVVLPAGFEPILRPAFMGIGSPQQQVQLEEHLKKGSELLSQDKADEAVSELLEAVKIDGRIPQTSTLEITHDEGRRFQIQVNSRSKTVLLMFWPAVGEGKRSKLAVLMPQEAGGKVLTSQFEHVEGAEYLLAEFKDVSDGVFSLYIEPDIKK